MKLRNKETGIESEYIEGSTYYSEEYWELVEGEYNIEMMEENILEENNKNTF